MRTVSAKLELSDRKADHFTHVEGKDRFALVLIDLGREAGIIAVPSFDREADTDRTEYAAAGRGLTLTRRLIEAAIKSGARTFTRIVLPGNVRMLNLLRDLALPEPLRYEDGIEFVEIDLLPKRS